MHEKNIYKALVLDELESNVIASKKQLFSEDGGTLESNRRKGRNE